MRDELSCKGARKMEDDRLQTDGGGSDNRWEEERLRSVEREAPRAALSL